MNVIWTDVSSRRTLLASRPPPLLKLAFWALVAIDALGIGLLFLLGLAAAGSTKSNPLQVALVLLVLPGIPLLGAVLLFTRTTSSSLRLLALLLAAAPLLIAVAARTAAQVNLAQSLNEDGEMTWYRSGPLREIAEAILRNDAATVARLAPTVDVNKKGAAGMTLLVLALRQLDEHPQDLAVLEALMTGKPDPNLAGQYEHPLELAIGSSGASGVKPVLWLLDAGAKPNLENNFGDPVFFLATGVAASPDVLPLLIARGADINTLSRQGETLLISAAMMRRWKTALVLLQNGADPSLGRNVSGLTFPQIVDSEGGHDDPDGSRAAVNHFLQQRRP